MRLPIEINIDRRHRPLAPLWINDAGDGRFGELISDLGFGQSSIHQDTRRPGAPNGEERHDRRKIIVRPQRHPVPTGHPTVEKAACHASRPIVDVRKRILGFVNNEKRAVRVDSSCSR